MSSTETARDLSALRFRVERFTEEHLPLVAAFSERYFSRPRSEAFYRWRYLESLPFSRLYLATSDNECLGMLCALRKPYLIAGERTSCLEIFDWHSLPGLRGSGVGIRLMRAMMREGERLIGVGGTPDAVKTLPAMGWQTVGTAMNYELPLSGRALEAGWRERVRARIPGESLVLSGIATWFRPRRRNYPGGSLRVSGADGELGELYSRQTGYDLLQVADETVLRWTTSQYAGSGEFRYWQFLVRGRLRGWALTRTYGGDLGPEAAIVEVYAPTADVELYAWMLSELSIALAAGRPALIRARATCPILQAALQVNRFRPGTGVPVFTWPKGLPSDLRMQFTLNHTDGPFRPYLPASASSHGLQAIG